MGRKKILDKALVEALYKRVGTMQGVCDELNRLGIRNPYSKSGKFSVAAVSVTMYGRKVLSPATHEALIAVEAAKKKLGIK